MRGPAVPYRRETYSREFPILKRAFLLTVLLPALLLFGGCVSIGALEKKIADAKGLKREMQDLQKRQEELKAENSALKDRLTKLNDDYSR